MGPAIWVGLGDRRNGDGGERVVESVEGRGPRRRGGAREAQWRGYGGCGDRGGSGGGGAGDKLVEAHLFVHGRRWGPVRVGPPALSPHSLRSGDPYDSIRFHFLFLLTLIPLYRSKIEFWGLF